MFIVITPVNKTFIFIFVTITTIFVRKNYHLPTFLLAHVSPTNQKQFPITMVLFQQPFHRSLVSYTNQKEIPMPIDNDQQIFCPSIVSHTNQENIPILIYDNQLLFHKFPVLHTNQKHILTTMASFH